MPRRHILTSIALWSLLAVTSLSAHADVPIARIFYFHSHECSSCKVISGEVLPPLLMKYGPQLEIRFFDIDIPENYEALLTLEEHYDLDERGIPQIFVGKWALVGERAIQDHLDRLVAEALESGGVDYLDPDMLPVELQTPTPGHTETPPTPSATLIPVLSRLPEEGCKWCEPKVYDQNPVVHMAYFHDASCYECDRVAYDLDLLYSRYPNLCIRTFDLDEDATLSEALGELYDVPAEKRLVAPSVFIGEDYLVTPDINMQTLTVLLEQYASSGSEPPWEKVSQDQAAQSIVERFASFSALTVIGAGLIDGLNPCAFAGIIFFVSYLAVTKRKGKEILLVGAAFTTGIFLSYLLIGLGILSFVRQLSIIRTFSRVVYIGTMILCAVLCLLSLYDYARIRQGRRADITLHLPKPLQVRLHKTIRQSSRAQSFTWAAFVTGFLVSFLEFACTGQVYLPTIVFVAGVPALRAHAVSYLVLYNMLFITPLVIIFWLAYLGTTWQQLNQFLETHMATLKLLTAGLFALLTVWLGIYIF